MNFEKDDNHIIEEEKGLATGEITPADRLQNQIRIATELYKNLNGEVNIDSEKERNNIMFFWVEEGYSKLYREIEDMTEFKVHPRLNGDIYKITAEDIIHYKKTGSLPE